jgi:sugar/nucleoside kinase (ribokinase family)
MSILVVGSVALETVETPLGFREGVLGGSATYFSASASFFTEVNLVAVVGEDFPEEHTRFLESRNIDLTGLVRLPGATFHWQGRSGCDLNQAQSLETRLNVFAGFQPVIPKAYAGADYLILANIDPELQLAVLDQMSGPKAVACDTMNYWIAAKPEALKQVLSRVDFFIINEAEARQLAGESNIVRAARVILGMGVKHLIVKRGEYGVLMFNGHSVFAAPAYPLEKVFDPTGAGDSFAGGFMGHLANKGEHSDKVLRQAVVFGSVMASFNVEDSSLDRLKSLSYPEIAARYRGLKRMTDFGGAQDL